MNQIGSLKYCHGSGNAHSIVSSEGCAVSGNPIAINVCFDRIFGKIMIFVAVFLRNHIKMGLQYNALAVLHSRSSRFADDNIANFVLYGLKAKVCSKIEHELLNTIFVVRRPWNLCQAVKVFPDSCGFQFKDFFVHRCIGVICF